ncbi:MAG: nucleotide sugar dehydrogenase [Betaproteobacteria bacterium]|nr:nucleotide sugar dehydrogenase [Betaproteobacteria bacterium]MDH3436993.1 nucleotide sugar dehydrogenase [Betaproteobacteria bacterium]
MKVSVVGLGKLGSPLAAVLASKGHKVIGVDVNAEYVRLLASGKAPVQEPQLQEFIDAGKGHLKATTSFEEAVLGSDIAFIIVPTPSDKNGVFTNKNVLAAIHEIGKALRKKNSYYIVNIISTVMPGSTGGEIREALEKSSGKRVGTDLGLCYNPEFIALGSVIKDLLNPDFILIGESDPRAGDMLEAIYKTSCDNTPRMARMNFVNAELTKISVNTYVTTKISYANMLSEICDRLPSADVNVVTSAIGLDSRIGTKYLKGATAYGGPCFPRDNVAFGVLAESIGARPDIARATDEINRYQADRVVEIIRRHAAPGSTVGVLGLSYKPDTSVIEESPGVAIALRLAAAGYTVRVHDPMALDAARAVLGDKATATESIEQCTRGAAVLVIATAWPQFAAIDPAMLGGSAGRPVVIDCWRMISKDRIGAAADVVYLGYGDHHLAESRDRKKRAS